MMASTVFRNLTRSVRRRMYSTQAAARKQPASSLDPEIRVSSLSNGMKIASLESNSPMSWVGMLVNAGPRHETSEYVGCSHFLRAGCELSTKKFPGYVLVGELSQSGGSLRCTTEREFTLYSIDGVRSGMGFAIYSLLELTSEQAFRSWELKSVTQPMLQDLALLHSEPTTELFELLHGVSYPEGLGRSLYAPSEVIGSFSQDQLLGFTRKQFTPQNMVMLGVGVDHEYMVEMVGKFDNLNRNAQDTPTKKSYFKGGEIRKDLPNSDLSYVAVAVEGPSLGSKEQLTASVLQHIMGTGLHTKYGSGSGTRLGKAVNNVAQKPSMVSCFNNAYSDSGMFGLFAVGDSTEMEKILPVVFSSFADVTKDGAVTDADVANAKHKLKSNMGMYLEYGWNRMLVTGQQLQTYGDTMNTETMFKMVDSITKQDVMNVAKKLVNGKQSMAAIGNLTDTPCLHELN